MKCKYFDAGWCYAPIDVVTSASSCGSCNYPEHCPYLKTEMSEKKFTIEPEAIEDIYLMSGIELPTNKKQRNREKNLIRSGYEMAYQNQQPEVMSSGTAIISDENGVPTKVHLSDKEKLTEMTKKMDSVESIEAEIKMLQSKLEFYKELKNTKSPVEEAYKDWYGAYPTDGIAVDNSWDAFQAGYNAAQKDYKVGEHQEPVKQKDTLYDLLGDFLQYSDHKESVCKIVRDWLDQNTTIVEEDYSTVTLKLKKGEFSDAN